MNFISRLLRFLDDQLFVYFSGNGYLLKNSLPYWDARNNSQFFKKGCSREKTKLQNIQSLCRHRKIQIIQNNRVKRSQIYFISSNICLIIWDLKTSVFTKMFLEAVVQMCSVKKVKISQNSQENTCAWVSFSIKLQVSGISSEVTLGSDCLGLSFWRVSFKTILT